MYKECSNPDVCFLTLARPADTLTAMVLSIVPRHRAAITPCRSVYDLVAALQDIPQDRPALLITRPSMLTRPHLMTALRQYPNLRLIGWLGADEKLSDPGVSSLSALSMVMVSGPEQLRNVIAGLQNSLVRESMTPDLQVPKQNPKIEPADYLLSNEEIDALLGAG